MCFSSGGCSLHGCATEGGAMLWITHARQVFFSTREMVARRNAKQGFQSSLEEVRLAKDFFGDVRQLWLMFLHYCRRLVLRCSLS